jgi:hypothetical protein
MPGNMFKSVTTRLIFWITVTTALLFSLAAFYAYRNTRDQAILDAERRAVLIAESEASQVQEVLRSAEEGARLLATTLGHTSASNADPSTCCSVSSASYCAALVWLKRVW